MRVLEHGNPLRPKRTVLKKDSLIILHFRIMSLSPRGGATVIYDPVTRSFGVSICSYRDNFNKKTGVAIAKKRLEENCKNCFQFDCLNSQEDVTMEEVRHFAYIAYNVSHK